MKWITHLVLIVISAGSGYFGGKLETSYRDARGVAAATKDVGPTVGKSADDGVPTSSPVSLTSTAPASPVTSAAREEAVDPPSMPEVALAKETPVDPPALAAVVPSREAPVDPAVLPEVTVVKEDPVAPPTLPTVVAKKEDPVTPPALPRVAAKKEEAVAPPSLPTVAAKKEPTPAPKVTEERTTPPTVVVVPTAPAPAVVKKDEDKKSVLVPAAPAKVEPQFRTEYQTVTETVYVQVVEEYQVCLGRGRCETRQRMVMRPQTVSRQVAVQVPVTGSTAAPSGGTVATVAGTSPVGTVGSAPAPMTMSCVPCGTPAVAPSYGSPYGSPGASFGCSTSGSSPQQGYSSCGSSGGNGRIVHGQPLRNAVRVIFHGGNGGFGNGNSCGGGGGFFRCR